MVRNNSTQEIEQVSQTFAISSRVPGTTPVASATQHPLVGLVSAPACPAGSFSRVKFQRTGAVLVNYTNWRACQPPSSMNVYVAGMYANSTYQMTVQTSTGGVVTNSPAVSFQTGTPALNTPTLTTPVPATSGDSLLENIVLFDFLNNGTSGYPIATDLKGNVVWYYGAFATSAQTGALMTRVITGGTMLVIADGPNSNSSATAQQILREIDLSGNALRETNATRIQEQLVAAGRLSNCSLGSTLCQFGAFHHEAIRLPNGHTLAFGDVEQIFPAGTQNSTAPVDILADMIVELDANFQLVWSWSAFDHDGGGTQLDINRPAILGETCSPNQGGCPPLFLATLANDWLHSNSLQYRSTDHNLIMSLRHQDWVLKIDYRDGQGTGNILWRLGNLGDFTINSTDPWPWFSHQHDANFAINGNLTLFDDGNTRVAQNPTVTEYSRGQAYNIDETNLIANPVLNAPLGVYSAALGSAQLLNKGSYNFLAGINQPGPFAQSIEVQPNGTIVFTEQANVGSYRSFRLVDLYTAPTEYAPGT